MDKIDILMEEERIDYLNDDYSETINELEKLSELELIKIEINEGLEEALKELDSLHDQFSKEDSAKLLDLCKETVIESITGQFGLASLFIESKDGGNVTTSHNFEKGITSTDADQQKYDNFSNVKNLHNEGWKEHRKKSGYDSGNFVKRKSEIQKGSVVIDEYTGRELIKGSGNTRTQASLDHIVPAHEIEKNAKAHLFKSVEERAKIATNDKNLAWTSESANKSKNDQAMEGWIDSKQGGRNITNEEHFEIDRKLALEKDKKARKFVKAEITVASVKKYGSELLATGGKDAVNMAAYSALGVIIRDFTKAVFEEIRTTFRERGKESLKEIFIRFKERISAVIVDIKAKWKDIFKGSIEAGITSFLSNIVVFVINLFATTLKKIVSMIRAGFVSLCQAIKMLVNPPEGMDREEANYQALKILTAGLIGSASLGLSAGIEKILQAIPGLQPLMMFPIPSIGSEQRTVSDIVAVTLSALAGGLLTTIVLYFMDKCRAEAKKDKLRIQLVTQSGVVVQYKIAQTYCVLADAYTFIGNRAVKEKARLEKTYSIIQNSGKTVDDSSMEYENVLKKLKERRKLEE